MARKRDIVGHWTEEARKQIVGKTVVEVRYLKKVEMDALGWTKSTLVMVFDDGTMLFPSMDDEGNGAGAMFGQGPKNEELVFPVISDYLMDLPEPTGGVPVSLERRHKNLLKLIQEGKRLLHARTGKTVLELEQMGLVTKRRVQRVVGRRNETQWAVMLTEKGKAA